MKNILCPTDLSDTAQGAVGYAAKLAKATGSSLTLLHVKSIFDFSLAQVSISGNASIRTLARQLEEQCREVSRMFKISCDAEVVSAPGTLSGVIGKSAKNYDLIVMGSNGVDDVYQFLVEVTPIMRL